MASDKICDLAGCSKLTRRKSDKYCVPHADRAKRHGDPLGGRVFVGEIQNFLRNTVLPYEGDDCLSWPYAKGGSKCGYGVMTMNRKQVYVHRYVCGITNGNPPTPKHQAAHSCGNGHLGCCNPRHLSWKTVSENHADKIIHGTMLRGERHPLSILTESIVLKIREEAKSDRLCDIAKRHGILPGMAHRIANRVDWAWLPDD